MGKAAGGVMAMTADRVVKAPSVILHTQGMVSSQLP